VKNDTAKDVPLGGWLNLLAHNKDDGVGYATNQIPLNNPGRTEAVEAVFIGTDSIASSDGWPNAAHDIAVAVEPIKAGGYGRCAFEGIVPARLAVTGPYGDPLTDEGIITNPPGYAGNNFFPGSVGEVPWHANPIYGETSVLQPVSNNCAGVRPIRILWIEDTINSVPAGATGPDYRNALVRLHGADTSLIKHVLCTSEGLKHPDQLRATQSTPFITTDFSTGVACDSTGIPIVRYSYSATGVATGPEVVQFLNFLQPIQQIRPSGVYVTVAQVRQQPNRAGGALAVGHYWAIANDHPTARGVRYEHGAQSDWLAGTSRTVTFFDVRNNNQTSFSGTVAQRLGTISESFDGIAVAGQNGGWNLVSCPITVLGEYKSLNTRLQALENANLINRVTALENA
jgi:hypothetical protein